MAHEILVHFQYAHLPAGPMRETSRMFGVLAYDLDDRLRDGCQKDMALEHLLIAKDAAVRQARLDGLES